MGSRWKMPNDDQIHELINNTNRTWTSINGVYGMKFTSKTDSTKYIFLPAAGSWSYTNYSDNNKRGYYWSTTFKYFALNSYAPGHLDIYNLNIAYNSDYSGYSVRARQVYYKKKSPDLQRSRPSRNLFFSLLED